VADFF